jgi:hypothetical protein
LVLNPETGYITPQYHIVFIYIELIIGFSPSLIFLQDRSVYPTGPNRITGWRQLFLS